MLQDKINRVIEICGSWGLYEHGASTAQKQMMYAATELAEFTKHYLEGKADMYADDIGDTAVCAINAYFISKGEPIDTTEYNEDEDKDYIETYCDFIVANKIGRIGVGIHESIDFNDSYCRESCYIEDVLLRLYYLAAYIDLTLEECLDQAISVIEKRKGKIVNGVFIKED